MASRERTLKLLALSTVVACSTFAPLALGQGQLEPLQLTLGAPGGRVVLTASSMNRDLSTAATASVIQLRGNVEIRRIACLPTGKDDGVVCEGTMVLHADEVDYNEKSGEINARSNVHVTPVIPSPPR